METCSEITKCVNYLNGKMTRKSLQKFDDRLAVRVLDLVHSDVCGPMNSMTPG